MYVAVRQYTGAEALINGVVGKEDAVRQTISGAPGFVAWYAIKGSGGSLTTVTLCSEKRGVEESTRRARAWIRENLPGLKMGPPAVTMGEAFLEAVR